MAEELKACPFCGSAAKFRWSGGVYLAECTHCGVSKGDDGGEGMEEITSQVTANWNRRATLPADRQDGMPERPKYAGDQLEYGHALEDYIEALEAWAAKRDEAARRYEWLRQHMLWDNVTIVGKPSEIKWTIFMLMPEPDIQGELTPETVPAQIDAAIDAAIASRAKGA